jgi:hypothetical protein
MNLITFHQKSDNFVGRSFSQLNTVVIGFQYLIYFLESQDAFSNEIYPFKEAFGWQLGIFKNQFINNISSSTIVLFNSLATISAVVPPHRITFPLYPFTFTASSLSFSFS